MRLSNLLAEDGISVINPASGKLVIAIIIIMALWGRKIDRGDE